jgi:tyrosinase
MAVCSIHGSQRGLHTMANEIRLRQGVHNLDEAHLTALRDAYSKMMAITDNRGWAYLAGLHGIPGQYCWHYQDNDRTALKKELFLPWHRAYLYHFEMAARDQVAGVTLPWWDWTLRPPRQNGLPKAFSDQTVNGRPNPLASYRISNVQGIPPHTTRRQPGPINGLPTQAKVNDALQRTDWYDFSDSLEDIHDHVHGWVGGDMCIVNIAAYDPIFWSHHCMVDRVWWLWQARNGNGNVPADLLDFVLAPFNMRVRDVLNVNDLGYDYAAAQTVVAIGGN